MQNKTEVSNQLCENGRQSTISEMQKEQQNRNNIMSITVWWLFVFSIEINQPMLRYWNYQRPESNQCHLNTWRQSKEQTDKKVHRSWNSMESIFQFRFEFRFSFSCNQHLLIDDRKRKENGATLNDINNFNVAIGCRIYWYRIPGEIFENKIQLKRMHTANLPLN